MRLDIRSSILSHLPLITFFHRLKEEQALQCPFVIISFLSSFNILIVLPLSIDLARVNVKRFNFPAYVKCPFLLKAKIK